MQSTSRCDSIDMTKDTEAPKIYTDRKYPSRGASVRRQRCMLPRRRPKIHLRRINSPVMLIISGVRVQSRKQSGGKKPVASKRFHVDPSHDDALWTVDNTEQHGVHQYNPSWAFLVHHFSFLHRVGMAWYRLSRWHVGQGCVTTLSGLLLVFGGVGVPVGLSSLSVTWKHQMFTETHPHVTR